MEIGKIHFSVIMATIAKRKKYFNNMNLIDTYYHWKTWVIGSVVGEIKCHNLKNVHFEKNPLVTNHKNSRFHD